MQNIYLGIDVSTSGVKALLMDERGQVIHSANTEQPSESPEPLWIEQDPEVWWASTLSSFRQLFAQSHIDPHAVKAVGMTGQMHGLTLLDENRKVLRPAILWNDQRCAEQCDNIRRIIGFERLVQICGNNALTGFTAPKLLWVADNEPEIYRKIRHVLVPKDYVRMKLTDELAVDCADGSGMILFDLRKRTWSDELLSKLGIDPAWLPKVYEGPEITGYITKAAAEITGLAEGTPVMAGGGDQAAGAVGVGAVQPGIMSLVLGTSGVVFVTTDGPFIEKQGRLTAFCHSAPGKWHMMGVTMAAAGSLRWFRDTFAPGKSYDELLKPAEAIPVGSEGLFFQPYLTGERNPHPDPLARGAFVGLTIRHNLDWMARSVLEGVAYALRDNFELMKEVGAGEIKQVRIAGGGARSALWRQILADVFNTPMVMVNTSDGAALGAALLAGVGFGQWSSVEQACAETISITGETNPSANVAKYQEGYRIYQDLYPTLRDITHRMAEM